MQIVYMPWSNPFLSEFHSKHTGYHSLPSKPILYSYIYHQMVSSNFFIRWPRLILVCWALAILPSIPLMFNSTIENEWEGKSNCKCFVPLDDVSISDLHHLLISQDIMFCYATNLHNSGCPTYYRWILGLIFLIFFPENLLVLDVPHNVLDSDFIHLLHLVDHGTPLYCGFRQVYKQQVGIRQAQHKLKNRIRYACSTAEILDCPRHAPDDTSNMPKMMPKTCSRHAPDMP